MARREPKRLGLEALYDYALRALARRPLTAGELAERLKKRAAHEADVNSVIQRLRRAGYLDDSRLSESYAYFRRVYEGFGRKRVLTDLRKRGVAPEVAEEAVAESYEGVDDLEMIRQQLRRRLGGSEPAKPIDDRRKVLSLYRALVRAGFPSDKIVIALREIASDTDWLDALAEQHLDSNEEVFD